MKGIILAGGRGTRLYPATQVICKQLLPVYDKPMIYYPLTTLMLAGIKEILIITNPHEKVLFQKLLGDGQQWGLQLHYEVQQAPNGLPEAFVIGEKFIGTSPVCLILGDNILYAQGLTGLLQETVRKTMENEFATIFGYYTMEPEHFGVVQFNDEGHAIKLVEKPKQHISNYAVIGLYFYPSNVIEHAKKLRPSSRGELEITDLNLSYLHQKRLLVKKLGRGTVWLDTGTPRSLNEASLFMQVIEERGLVKVACPEEVAWRMGNIDSQQLYQLASPLAKTSYGEYLLKLLDHAEECVV